MLPLDEFYVTLGYAVCYIFPEHRVVVDFINCHLNLHMMIVVIYAFPNEFYDISLLRFMLTRPTWIGPFCN
jgi:hypothetical protein